MKTVTFCGHGDLSRAEISHVIPRLLCTLENLINNGAVEFLLGDYGDFDKLCAKTLYFLKNKYPHIVSVCVTPYMEREYSRILYDLSEYPPLEKVPKRIAIIKRNEYMIDKSDIVVSYITHTFGGAYTSFKYAKRKHKNIIMLGYDDADSQ